MQQSQALNPTTNSLRFFSGGSAEADEEREDFVGSKIPVESPPLTWKTASEEKGGVSYTSKSDRIEKN